MARGKTKMARIEDETVLKSTFKKRKNGLIKKIQELTILCDIIACVIIYGPMIGGRPPEIFTWPEDQEKVRAAITMYQEKQDNLKRTTDLCNLLKNRRRLDMSDSGHHQVNNMALSGGGFYDRQGMPPEAALGYLNWVDARIKAVDERIELVKNSGNMMLFGNDQCHNVMFDDKMMAMPANRSDQDGNFGHRFLQEWPYQQNTYGDFAQFEPHVYDQTMCCHCAYNNPMYMNFAPEASHFQQAIIDLNAMGGYQQIPNQMCSYDPYLLGMEQRNITLGTSINRCLQYQQQLEHNSEKMQLNKVTQTQSQCHPLMSGKMNDLMQLCPYLDEWSSPDAGSSNYSSSSSNQLNKAAAAAAALDDPLEYSTSDLFLLLG